MESAIKTVVEVYLKFAGTKENLSGSAFQKMVKKQLGNIMTDTDSSGAIKEMRQGLDDNQDGKVSFPEYMTLVGYLANTLSEQKVKDQEAAGGAPAAQEIP
ncbi:protein S100-A16-like [Conger conger]|uniref:protein S100-A16-like n=1 Tax=Conger conger TaxID=82655 RepID=UPI002A59D7D4|nr:protein S100-A16-like [Conger conger]XP_061111442.1 protein S100-A16-like [Conger conger]